MADSCQNGFKMVNSEQLASVSGQILNHLDVSRSEVTRKLDPENRSALGQFLTPSPIAMLMAGMFRKRKISEIHILDPGAGVGILFSALVLKLIRDDSRPKKITVTAFEIESVFFNYLLDTFALCKEACANYGVEFEGILEKGDFISIAASRLGEKSMGEKSNNFTHVIVNPPYHKIGASSHSRIILKELNIETGNLYTGFIALCASLLTEQGQMVSITPRSFCNGVYFKKFREFFFDLMKIDKIHVFQSRTDAFKEDAVLQENVILKLHKGRMLPRNVDISSSFSSGDEPNTISVPYSEVISPDDKDLVVRIPIGSLDRRISILAGRLKEDLDSLNLRVSTGPIVDFRVKESISPPIDLTVMPLIYPVHIVQGYVEWPAIKPKRPDGIRITPQTRRFLLPPGYYVVIKRFSSKEEHRRIVAGVFDPNRIKTQAIGLENHVNYLHCLQTGLSENMAKGITAFLNSSIIDTVFRLFSGHTQVNASDLRRIKFPSAVALESLGSKIGDHFPIGEDLDRIVERELLDMSTLDSDTNPVAAKAKIQQALEILKAIGAPRAQQNERSALTLLALLGLKPGDNWEHASNPMCGITPMMEFFAQHYGKQYKPNTRETVRRQTVHQFLAAGFITENPDKPSRPTNSPKAIYQIEPTTLALLRSFGATSWDENLKKYLTLRKTLTERYAQDRDMQKIPIRINNEITEYISPGGQNLLIKEIIDEFAPRFSPGGIIVYLGDTAKKLKHFDENLLKSLNVKIDVHGKLPDLIIFLSNRNWLFLIEAVTSHGPINPKRREELIKLFSGCKANLIFVTAFSTRKKMLSFLDEISWETEVWIAETPAHLIHFNGDKFLGPESISQ